MTLAYRHDRSPMPGHDLTADEKAREPRSLALVAWFDGWAQAQGISSGSNGTYPRRLTAGEQAKWREGFNEARADLMCHRAHGFGPCTVQAHKPDPDPDPASEATP